MRRGRGLPRLTDVVVAALALVLLSPLLALLALVVRATSPGPALFQQVRLGQGAVPFTLLKLRTMTMAPSTVQLTVGDDPRITVVGGWLRRRKLDELPQLINVVRGDMALVGPRPEVPELVHDSEPVWQVLLRYRPGLTDPASLAFCDEADLLSGEPDPVKAYRERILPAKLRLSSDYLTRRTVASDLRVLACTAARVLAPRTQVRSDVYGTVGKVGPP